MSDGKKHEQPFSGSPYQNLSTFGVPTNNVNIGSYQGIPQNQSNYGGFNGPSYDNLGSSIFPQNNNLGNINNNNGGFSGLDITGGDDNSIGGVDILQTLQGITNAYLGYKNLGLSEDQFGFTKDSFNSNLANSTQAYNTDLEGRQRARLGFQGKSGDPLETELNSFLGKNRLNGAPI